MKNLSGVGNLTSKHILLLVCALYVAMAAIVGSSNLDTDEFGMLPEPYEMLGGDYTTGYLGQGKYAEAARTALNSYRFYWNYRPLSLPLISDEDKDLFAEQEREFGYQKPDPVQKKDGDAVTSYQKRLIVPEPDRFYRHGAGKPLLSAVISIPQLALVKLVTTDDKNLLYYQYNYNYHPVFIVARLAQILSGLATIFIVFWVISTYYDQRKALLGAAVVALMPVGIKYFPNIHQDSVLAPFVVLSAFLFLREKYWQAGVSFGLALAAKNMAVLLLPALLICIGYEAWLARGATLATPRTDMLGKKLRGLLTFLALGFLTLLPFANPVSYANELLTPVTSRQLDSRGENLSHYRLSERMKAPGIDVHSSTIRFEVRVAEMFLRLQDIGFFFFVLAIFLFLSRPMTPLVLVSFLMLLCVMPYGLLLGDAMNWRALLFLPFFAVLCVEAAPARYLALFGALLLSVDVLYLIDPITTDSLHYLANDETPWSRIWR
jgi:hypothetical protein